MPEVICNQHGGNFAPYGCRHAAERVWAGQPVGHLTFVNLDGFFFKSWVCDECLEGLNQMGLQAYLADQNTDSDCSSETGIDPLIDTLDLQPICRKCLEEALRGSADT